MKAYLIITTLAAVAIVVATQHSMELTLAAAALWVLLMLLLWILRRNMEVVSASFSQTISNCSLDFKMAVADPHQPVFFLGRFQCLFQLVIEPIHLIAIQLLSSVVQQILQQGNHSFPSLFFL